MFHSVQEMQTMAAIQNTLFGGKTAFALDGSGDVNATNDGAMCAAVARHDPFQLAHNVRLGATRYEIAYIEYRCGKR